MNKKFLPRELLYMSLPVLLLAGTAWWLESGSDLETPPAGMRPPRAKRPGVPLRVKAASGIWTPPTTSAVWDAQEDCEVSAVINTPTRIAPGSSNVPRFLTTDVVDENGRSLMAFYGKKRVLASGATSGITTMGTASRPAGYTVLARVPLSPLPRSTRSATFVGTVGWGTAKPVRVAFQVIPAWMRRDAKRLRVQSVKWRPGPTNNKSEVEVVCRLRDARTPYVYPARSSNYWSHSLTWPPGTKNPDIILAEWSQRIESDDGRLNSLSLIRDHVKKDRDACYVLRIRGFSENISLRKFNPLCQVRRAKINNGILRLTYSISPIPKTFKNPVFCCEIYLVGDGMVSVRCPLK